MRNGLAIVVLLAVTLEIPTDYVDAIEVNTFGPAPGRTALLYRDRGGEIVDWRWWSEAARPRYIAEGRYVVRWDDGGTLRQVYCRRVTWTRTVDDVEILERKFLPHDKRRKLAR